MNPVPTESNNDVDIRQRILAAAEARFRTFGYNKTSMAEIATDVGMSAANLYRYFENKHDIAAACASRCMGERTVQLRNAVRKPGLSATARLRAFISGTLQYTWEQAESSPRINELVGTITSQRQDIVHEKIQGQVALLAEILAHGNETGEFDIPDVIRTARAVYASLTLFEVPLFNSLYSQDEFRDIANDVADLLLRGLEKR
jgi:AcrR family transcriptional regulator